MNFLKFVKHIKIGCFCEHYVGWLANGGVIIPGKAWGATANHSVVY